MSWNRNVISNLAILFWNLYTISKLLKQTMKVSNIDMYLERVREIDQSSIASVVILIVAP